uniref:Uncharacterized protein n=1 Tax=Salix viminalis TaxID=40686 RepID=A0A6N2KLM2_SALVM
MEFAGITGPVFTQMTATIDLKTDFAKVNIMTFALLVVRYQNGSAIMERICIIISFALSFSPGR